MDISIPRGAGGKVTPPIHLQRQGRATALQSTLHTTIFVAFGVTTYSLEIVPKLCLHANDAGLDTLSTQDSLDSYLLDTPLLKTTGNTKRYPLSRLHLPYTEGRTRMNRRL